MNARSAWYWPTPISPDDDEELAGRFYVVEGRVDGQRPYRLLVDVRWVPVSPLPELDGMPPTQGFFTADITRPEAARVAILRLPFDQGLFAYDLAEKLLASEGLELFEDSPASHVDFRGVARGGGRLGYVSIAQHEGYWHIAFGLGAEDDLDGLDGVRASWATFHLVQPA